MNNDIKLMWIKYLLYVRNCAKYFSCMNSFRKHLLDCYHVSVPVLGIEQNEEKSQFSWNVYPRAKRQTENEWVHKMSENNMHFEDL